MRQSRSHLLLAALAVIALGLGLSYYFYYQAQHPSTDNAYVQAHLIHINSQVSGEVDTVAVSNHQHVTAGQLLFTLDQTRYRIALAKANAQRQEAINQVNALKNSVVSAKERVLQRQAELTNTKKATARTINMSQRHLTSESARDTAISQLQVAKAAYAAAQSDLKKAQASLGNPNEPNANIRLADADVNQAELDLRHTHITAPVSGYINQLSLRHGDAVTALTPLFAVVDDSQWWVSANFKETQLERIRPGQAATITLDLYPGHTLHGQVRSISTGSGSAFSLLPAENASGNWVKVTQRFPVWVSLTPNNDYPLRIGASATVTVNTHSRT